MCIKRLTIVAHEDVIKDILMDLDLDQGDTEVLYNVIDASPEEGGLKMSFFFNIPGCDGDCCRSNSGKVKKIPLPNAGNAHLCYDCFVAYSETMLEAIWEGFPDVDESSDL